MLRAARPNLVACEISTHRLWQRMEAIEVLHNTVLGSNSVKPKSSIRRKLKQNISIFQRTGLHSPAMGLISILQSLEKRSSPILAHPLLKKTTASVR